MKPLIAATLLLLCQVVVAGVARTVRLDEKTVAAVKVTPGFTTILSFPMKPSKVLLGNRGLFGVEYVESDVAISALKPGARSNMYVYLEGRRFAFSLSTAPSGGDEIILVRDATLKVWGRK